MTLSADDGRDTLVETLAELAAGLGAIAEAVHAGGWPALSAAELVAVAGQVMPGARDVTLAVMDGGRMTLLAASGVDQPVLEVLHAQSGQDPALAAAAGQVPVVVDELASDPRWPILGAQLTAQTGLRSLLSCPLRLDGRSGALTFYSDWPFWFDQLAVSAGTLVAAYCSLAGSAVSNAPPIPGHLVA